MANPEHLAILKKGVNAWNRWREEGSLTRPDLGGADLNGANLRGVKLPNATLLEANLLGADLTDADLSGASLGHSNLAGAMLRGATLIGAFLQGANLTETDANGADLTWADLDSANLRQTDLSFVRLFQANLAYSRLNSADITSTDLTGASLDHADFSAARAHLTTFNDVDLSQVKGLEAVVHLGPSSIGIDTIYRSGGKIPHAFLRGAGVPENFIEYMASLVGTGIEFYSLFISYSTKDQKFADRLYADLQSKGVRCWFAPHEMLGGKKIIGQIDEAIRMYDKLLLILSPASMDSEWVRTEIAIARKREKEQKKEVLFPIALCPLKKIKEWEYFDSDIGKDSAREIREYHIPNFTKWKTDQDAYQKEFNKLLKALQGKPEPASA